jgi:hypothetical protein
MDGESTCFARVKLVYGVPIDSVSLVAAATCYLRHRKAALTFAMIAKRKANGTLQYKPKVSQKTRHVGDLPKEVVDLILEDYWHVLYNDKKLGYPHFDESVFCPGCRRIGYDMLDEVFTGEDCDQCNNSIMGWFETQGRDKVRPYPLCWTYGQAKPL